MEKFAHKKDGYSASSKVCKLQIEIISIDHHIIN